MGRRRQHGAATATAAARAAQTWKSVAGDNMNLPAGCKMPFAVAVLTAMLSWPTVSAHAYQELQTMHQAESRSGRRIAVEESTIHIIRCNGPGENGGQFYIYQYLKRTGFRAILPPNWSR